MTKLVFAIGCAALFTLGALMPNAAAAAAACVVYVILGAFCAYIEDQGGFLHVRVKGRAMTVRDLAIFMHDIQTANGADLDSPVYAMHAHSGAFLPMGGVFTARLDGRRAFILEPYQEVTRDSVVAPTPEY